jgi:hypothetical protein
MMRVSLRIRSAVKKKAVKGWRFDPSRSEVLVQRNWGKQINKIPGTVLTAAGTVLLDVEVFAAMSQEAGLLVVVWIW